MQAATTIPIYLDERGVAWVDDTNTKVREIVLDQIAFGWGPEQIHEQYPYLSLAHIHAAFSYYYAHKEEVDAEIQRSLEFAEQMREQARSA